MKLKDITKSKVLETHLVLIGACVIVFLIYNQVMALYISLVLLFIGIFVPKIAIWVCWLWFKLADILGFFTSRIVLSFVFFIVLTPIAFVYRMLGKDPLSLKKPKLTNWSNRSQIYKLEDIEDPW